jgi:DNA polymerase-3 subunit gamma/tau
MAPMNDAASSDPGYRVLARKYRPATFAQLIGQEALVRTLTNAINLGRLAHGFMLTGVRGVGKTTTARIIARALNCIGPDGKGGPTIEPCGVCVHCQAISEDRHLDVIEMDAASRSKVEEMRELLDGVRYRPTSARYKIYIIDEVHMLSAHSFNALLKTLEEPPAHVKFVFATTEIRKVPVTVLSRCQRFDLRRIDVETLTNHFRGIVAKEGVKITDPALALLARAADGSVRDGLSLLDQAIAHGSGTIEEEEVRRMLGLADRTVTFDLLDAVFRGAVADALNLLASQYEAGADPTQVLEDMLDLVHWLTRIKIVPGAADDPAVPEAERVRGRSMTVKLSMAVLTRAWQMLLKGLNEVMHASSPLQTAEMVLIRLAYAADLPTPADALGEAAKGGGARPVPSSAGGGAPAGAPVASAPAAPVRAEARIHAAPSAPTARAAVVPRAEAPSPAGAPGPEVQPLPDPGTFEEVVALAEAKREMLLFTALRGHVHLVSFERGRIGFRPDANAPRDLANQLTRFLNEVTARRWVVAISSDEGQATLRQQSDALADAARARAKDHPLIKAVLEQFPGAKIGAVRTLKPSEETPPDTPLAEEAFSDDLLEPPPGED